MDGPETRYAKSGDLHIAYQVTGEGPFDVVVLPPLYSGVDTLAFDPVYGDFSRRVTSFARMIVFDPRGTGSSDQIAGAPSLEERSDDVRAVMEGAGSSSAAMLGASAGAAMSLLFAATYPDKVFALVLFMPQVRYVWAPDFPWAPTREAYERKTAQLVRDWASGDFDANQPYLDTDYELPSRMRRLSASPGTVAALRRMDMDVDVRSILPAIHVPTVVIFQPEANSAGNARYIVDRIPGSQAVEIAAPEWVERVPEILEEFLPQAWQERQQTRAHPPRVLATVLFTDLVDSSTRATELGPRWHELLGRHNAAVRQQLARFRGREIDTAGDGFFASGFDGPARAIRCGCAIRDAIGDLGLGVRVGVHTGECDIVDGKLSGLAVNIGARVAEQAGDGEVLVSGTVKDLVAGSGIAFAARGVRELKGLGEWPLYEVARSDENGASET